MAEDTFPGHGEREPMLVSELLEELGLTRHPVSDQLCAVLEWCQHHGDTAKPILRAGIEMWVNDANWQLGLATRRPGSIDGEEFVRSLGFDEIGDKIAEIKRRRGGD